MQRSLGSDDLGRTIMVFMQAIEFLEPERPSISDHLPAVTLDELVLYGGDPESTRFASKIRSRGEKGLA